LPHKAAAGLPLYVLCRKRSFSEASHEL